MKIIQLLFIPIGTPAQSDYPIVMALDEDGSVYVSVYDESAKMVNCLSPWEKVNNTK